MWNAVAVFRLEDLGRFWNPILIRSIMFMGRLSLNLKSDCKTGGNLISLPVKSFLCCLPAAIWRIFLCLSHIIPNLLCVPSRTVRLSRKDTSCRRRWSLTRRPARHQSIYSQVKINLCSSDQWHHSRFPPSPRWRRCAEPSGWATLAPPSSSWPWSCWRPPSQVCPSTWRASEPVSRSAEASRKNEGGGGDQEIRVTWQDWV